MGTDQSDRLSGDHAELNRPETVATQSLAGCVGTDGSDGGFGRRPRRRLAGRLGVAPPLCRRISFRMGIGAHPRRRRGTSEARLRGASALCERGSGEKADSSPTLVVRSPLGCLDFRVSVSLTSGTAATVVNYAGSGPLSGIGIALLKHWNAQRERDCLRTQPIRNQPTIIPMTPPSSGNVSSIGSV